MKACGLFIMGGSQTIAHLQTGFKVDRILELSEDIQYTNAYHFTQNYKDILIINPSMWNNELYLTNLNNNQYDLIFANNPCSGLSSINRKANVNQPINKKFNDVFHVVNITNPKTFLIENAPGLVTIGTPILHQMINLLSKKYRFTIIRDLAGNHGVPMKRMRTFIIGWNKEYFNGVPILQMNHLPNVTIKNVFIDNPILLDCYNYNEYDTPDYYKGLQKYYYLVKPKQSIYYTLATIYDTPEKIDELDIQPQHKTAIKRIQANTQNNKGSWDKSPIRLDFNLHAQSLTSLSRFIHPIENRDCTIREYARIMGYPDSFRFYRNKCHVSCVQAIAQGVPVNFIRYISNEIKSALNDDRTQIQDVDIIYQQHIAKIYTSFSVDEFQSVSNLNNDYKRFTTFNLEL